MPLLLVATKHRNGKGNRKLRRLVFLALKSHLAALAVFFFKSRVIDSLISFLCVYGGGGYTRSGSLEWWVEEVCLSPRFGELSGCSGPSSERLQASGAHRSVSPRRPGRGMLRLPKLP